jgi:hypothetical protein
MQEQPKKQAIYFSKKIILVVFFSVFFSFSPVANQKAQAWDAIPGAIFKQATEEISYTIKGVIMGALRQAAIKMLTQQMDRFMSGVSGNGARFITNWEDYLIDNPTRNAQKYANDYISRALAGRGSVSYKKAANSVAGASTMRGEGFGREAVLGDATELYSNTENYADSLQTMAQEKIIEPKPWELTYPDDPADMFESDTLANMNLYLNGDGNGGNTVWDAESAVSKEYHSALQKEQKIASDEALSGNGFLSEKIDGMVAKPGILFKEMQANADNLPNLAVTSANSIGELIAATVSKAITGVVTKAVSGVEKAINREATKVTDKAVKEVNANVNKFGPGALYE